MQTETTQDWKQMTRKERGKEVAKTCQIMKTTKGWEVQSQSGHGKYLVHTTSLFSTPECTCPDYDLRKQPCKHIYAVETILQKEIDQQGNVTITQTKRVTYPQNWPAYTAAQCNEQPMFMTLLASLCKTIPQPEYVFGRPTLPLSDMVFASALKVYSTFSLRRFVGDMKTAHEKGHIENPCSYVSVSNYMRNPELTPILHKLLQLSSLPLASVETTFAPDSSGFRTTKFNEYCKEKHGTGKKHQWVKAHVLIGTETHIIASARITDGNANDCPQFTPMVNEAHNGGFTIKEIPADMGYSSRENYETAQSIGATAYIPFKSNSTGKQGGSQIWGKMWHYFQLNREEFMEHYHARSNVESGFNMIKSKFGDNVRSKDKTAQVNEMLLKLLCHNIVVLVHETFELGISPQFCLISPESVKKVA